MSFVRSIVVILAATLAAPSAMAAERVRSAGTVERRDGKGKRRSAKRIRRRHRTAARLAHRRHDHRNARRHGSAVPAVAAVAPAPAAVQTPPAPPAASHEDPLAAIDRRITNLQMAVTQAQERMDDLKESLLNPPSAPPKGAAGASAPSI